MAVGLAPLAVGDRIKRRGDLNDRTSWRYGAITEIYQGVPDGKGHTMPMYAVKWEDTGAVERGYLRVSLIAVPADLPPIVVPTSRMV